MEPQEGENQGIIYYTSVTAAKDASRETGKPVYVIDPILGDKNFHTIFWNGKNPEGYDNIIIGGPMTLNENTFVAAPGARPQPSSGE